MIVTRVGVVLAVALLSASRSCCCKPIGSFLSCAPSPPVVTNAFEPVSSSSSPRGCRRPPVRTSVLRKSRTTSWNGSFAAAHRGATFSLRLTSCRQERSCPSTLLQYLVPHCCCASCFHLQIHALLYQQLLFPASDAAAVLLLLSSLLLCFLLPPSDSRATVSTVALPASDAAAVLLLLSSLLLCFMLLPSDSCFAFSTRVLSVPAAAAVFFASILVSCASFLFSGGGFFYCDDNFLISFFKFRFSTVVFLGFIFLFSIHSRLVLCVSSPVIVLFSQVCRSRK